MIYKKKIVFFPIWEKKQHATINIISPARKQQDIAINIPTKEIATVKQKILFIDIFSINITLKNNQYTFEQNKI